MASSETQIKEDIRDYIAGWGSHYPNWYVGIATDPEQRLFGDHKVKRNSDYWIYRIASSADVARRVESYFVNTLGTDGGEGGGTKDSRAVYAYRKTPRTEP